MILRRSAPPGRVCVLHHRAEDAEAIARLLRPAGHRLFVTGGAGGEAALVQESPDLLVAAAGAPGLAATVRHLRARLGRDLPVLLIVGSEPATGVVEADEMIREPIDAGELDLRVLALLAASSERRRLEKKLRELSALRKVSWAFSLSGGASGFYKTLTQQTAELLGAQKAVLLLFDRDHRSMVAQLPAYGLTREEASTLSWAVDGRARETWNFRTSGALLCADAAADARVLPELAAALGLRSLLAVPVVRGPEVLGVLAVANRHGGEAFGEDDLQRLVLLAGEAALALGGLGAYEKLKRTERALAEQNRVLADYAAVVSHDFQKPLMAIRGFAELTMTEDDLAPEARREFMRTVINEVDALTHLAHETLLRAQMESTEPEYAWSEIEVGSFILETIPVGLSDHSVLVEIDKDLPALLADHQRLRQVLTNLLSNALKYSPTGSAITVRGRRAGPNELLLQVVDHGIGIRPEQAADLFQKFQRLRHDSHPAPGNGLGLYICRLIVEAHGGRIWFEPTPGRGATFCVSLPIRGRRASDPALHGSVAHTALAS